MNTMTDGRLSRLRWGARAALMLGIAASLVANVLHAHADAVSRGIAAWPPVALLIAFELVIRIPVQRGWQSWTRAAAAALVAGIGAWLSYWHMVAVAASHGENQHGGQYLLPLTVDGLAVVASICLVELAAVARRRVADEPVGSAVPAVELNEGQREILAVAERAGIDAAMLDALADWWKPETDAPATPYPWERSSADAPTSPGAPAVK